MALPFFSLANEENLPVVWDNQKPEREVRSQKEGGCMCRCKGADGVKCPPDESL